MKFVSLFAGIGGFDLGLERAGMQSVGQVEINPFCQRVLAYHWPNVKRVGDIRNVNGTEFAAADLICGGFPCQPFSHAGKRRGKADDRYLWPEMLRIIKAYRPAWVLGENVAGIVSMALDTVLSDLEAQGYKCQAFIIPACSVDAKHERKRVYIVAHSESIGGRRGLCETGTEQNRNPFADCRPNVPDPNGTGFGERWRSEPIQPEQRTVECFSKAVSNTINDGHNRAQGNAPESSGNESNNGLFERGNTWIPEPGLGRVAHGVPGRVDRLRSLGNAVVPQVIEVIGRAIQRAHVVCAERLPDTKEARLTAHNSRVTQGAVAHIAEAATA
jgi:DNA (cytosine-5)-methyltransferase 1